MARTKEARALAFTFPEPLVLEGIRAARNLNLEIVTVARTKFATGVEMLQKEGVHHIFHDKVTSRQAMVSAVLGRYSVED